MTFEEGLVGEAFREECDEGLLFGVVEFEGMDEGILAGRVVAACIVMLNDE